MNETEDTFQESDRFVICKICTLLIDRRMDIYFIYWNPKTGKEESFCTKNGCSAHKAAILEETQNYTQKQIREELKLVQNEGAINQASINRNDKMFKAGYGTDFLEDYYKDVFKDRKYLHKFMNLAPPTLIWVCQSCQRYNKLKSAIISKCGPECNPEGIILAYKYSLVLDKERGQEFVKSATEYNSKFN